MTSEALVDNELEHEENLTQYVNFMLGDEFFALHMQEVEEIIRLPTTFSVPLTPSYLIGLSNLRGQILPVLCLRTLLCMDRASATEATRVIVITIGKTKIGFTVDRVVNVATPDPEMIKPTNTAGGKIDPTLITNTIHSDNQIIQVLNCHRLLDNSVEEELELSTQRFNHLSSQSHFGDVIDEERDDDEDMRQLVCCMVDGQEYAFPLEDTQEIVRIPEIITKVPLTESAILGVINLRGKTLPLVSLRTLFGLPSISFSDSHRVLVVNISLSEKERLPVGVVVDAVREVIRLHVDVMDSVPEIMSKMGQANDISAICNLDDGRRTLSVISVEQLFDAQIVDQFSEAYPQEGTDMSTIDDVSILEDDNTDMQLVIFKLDKEEFGISIHTVQEIIRIPENISRVPKTDDFIEGVIYLRGNVLPIVDMRKRFHLPEMARHERQRILVVNFEKISTGFIVDSVSEVLRIPESQLEDAPVLSEEQAQLMRQMVNLSPRMIGVLSADQLISNTEMYKLHMAANDMDS
ncbi:chemotaxis protein CheW [Vibrio cholerae]